MSVFRHVWSSYHTCVNLVLVTKDFPWGGFCSNQILDYLFISFPVGRVFRKLRQGVRMARRQRQQLFLRSRLPVSTQAGARKSFTVPSSDGLQGLPTVSRSCFSFSLVRVIALECGRKNSPGNFLVVCFCRL